MSSSSEDNQKGVTYEPGSAMKKHSFDDLVRGMSDGDISRGRALRLVGATLFGAFGLARVPGVAEAQKHHQHTRVNKAKHGIPGGGGKKKKKKRRLPPGLICVTPCATSTIIEKCCPNTHPTCCSADVGGGCCIAGKPICCGNNVCCNSEFPVCDPANNQCCPADAPIGCSGGHCCDEAHPFCGEEFCFGGPTSQGITTVAPFATAMPKDALKGTSNDVFGGSDAPGGSSHRQKHENVRTNDERE